MIRFNWYRFEDLDPNHLYQILALRSDVFVVEQKCAFLDPDGKDLHALHLLGMDETNIHAYLRLLPPTEMKKDLTFGRVVTAKTMRSKGYGKALITELLRFSSLHFPHQELKCSAQCYLKDFYENFGFISYGAIYEEDGIPHIEMKHPNK